MYKIETFEATLEAFKAFLPTPVGMVNLLGLNMPEAQVRRDEKGLWWLVRQDGACARIDESEFPEDTIRAQRVLDLALAEYVKKSPKN